MASTLKQFLSISAGLALVGMAACGGGGGGGTAQSTPPIPPAATTLAYVDPALGTYLLKKDTALSSGSHLVLDLVGPTTGTASGVTLTLQTSANHVTWVDVPAGGTTSTLVQNGTQFSLGTGTPILKGKTFITSTTGVFDILQATVAQKGLANPASLNGVLLRVALDLKPGLGLAQGTAINLTADATKSQALDGAGTISPITVSVGTLTAQ